MNSRVSAPVESRNHSAFVRADRATRSRAPGGSFIWPKNMTVLSMTDLPVAPILVSCISSQRSFPSRVRSPTPAKTEKPLWTLAMRAISSVRITVLPSPAPPKRPILPPRTNGVSRSTTLIPVSKTSVLGERFSNSGRIAVDRPALGRRDRPPAVDRVAQQVEDAAQRLLADRHAHRAAGVDHRHPADQPVGRAQGHAAHPVAAELLLHLAGQVDLDPLLLGLDLQCVVDVGQMPLVEIGVEGRADHLGNPSGRGRRWPCGDPLVRFSAPYVMEAVKCLGLIRVPRPRR